MFSYVSEDLEIKHRHNFRLRNFNLYSYLSWLNGCLAWPHIGIAPKNTQFEFPGFSINVPRILQGPFLSVRHASPISPVSPSVHQSVSPSVRQSICQSVCRQSVNKKLQSFSQPSSGSGLVVPQLKEYTFFLSDRTSKHIVGCKFFNICVDLAF